MRSITVSLYDNTSLEVHVDAQLSRCGDIVQIMAAKFIQFTRA